MADAAAWGELMKLSLDELMVLRSLAAVREGTTA
jgi:hypothetical protein